jgi:ATP-dependent RNA helicase SUPV3L1/SUV3
VHFGRPASDLLALERLMHDPDVRASTRTPRLVERFFEHCQVPDFEKTGPVEHAEIVRELWQMSSARRGVVEESWLARRVREVDDTQGDLETLVARLARVRTLAYVVALNSIASSILRSIWRDILDDEDDELFDDKYWSPKRIALAVATEPL